MNAHIDCFPCYLRQALQAARFSSDDELLHWKAVRAVAEYLSGLGEGIPSMEAAENVHQRIKAALGDPDPYKKVKEEFSAAAERMEPMIEEIAATGGDPLMTAVKVAIAGNIIDFGTGGEFDVGTAIRDALEFPFAVNHFDAFKEAVGRARTVFFIGDNTGEIYFDKPLLRLLAGKKITFAVRGGPILNDATIEYALRAGLDKFAALIDTGISVPGFPLDRVRPEAREEFEAADIVISKGQANFETLHMVLRPSLFFLLKIKCNLVTRMIQGTKCGDIVIMESGRVPLNNI